MSKTSIVIRLRSEKELNYLKELQNSINEDTYISLNSISIATDTIPFNSNFDFAQKGDVLANMTVENLAAFKELLNEQGSTKKNIGYVVLDHLQTDVQLVPENELKEEYETYKKFEKEQNLKHDNYTQNLSFDDFKSLYGKWCSVINTKIIEKEDGDIISLIKNSPSFKA